MPTVSGTSWTRQRPHPHQALALTVCPPSPPPQVVIVPIVKKDTDRASVSEAVDKLCGALKAAGIRVKVGGPRGEGLFGGRVWGSRVQVQLVVWWGQKWVHTAARRAPCSTLL